MILGYFLGAALLTKTPAMVNLVVLPFSIIGFSFSKGKYKLLKLLGCWIVAIIIALSMYNLLRLGPEFQMLSARNADYVFSPSELSGRPLDPFVPHLRDIVDWFPKFLTWPVILFMGYGLWVVGGLFAMFRYKYWIGCVRRVDELGRCFLDYFLQHYNFLV